MANVLDKRSNALLEYVDVGLADGSRIPNVEDAIDSFVSIVGGECEKKKDSVAGNDVEFTIVHDNVDGLLVARRKLCNSLGDVPQVARSLSRNILLV